MARATKESQAPNLETEQHTRLMEVLRRELPAFCRDLDKKAAGQLLQLDMLLRDRKHLSLEAIDSVHTALNPGYLSSRCDQLLEKIAKAGLLDTKTLPTLFFELRNNTPFVKDNATVIRIYQELLLAYKRRNLKEEIEPELLALY